MIYQKLFLVYNVKHECVGVGTFSEGLKLLNGQGGTLEGKTGARVTIAPANIK